MTRTVYRVMVSGGMSGENIYRRVYRDEQANLYIREKVNGKFAYNCINDNERLLDTLIKD